jgi:light-harvesting complex I chlorophyll a/b binding protein 4
MEFLLITFPNQLNQPQWTLPKRNHCVPPIPTASPPPRRQRAPEWLPWFREAELKNGRVAMLATVGFVVPEFVRIPGEAYSFESIPRVLDAHDALPDSMIQIFAWISFLEACTFPAVANMDGFDRMPGDYSFDPLGLKPTDPAKLKQYQLSELKNGRLAMIAIGGMVAGASVTGHGFPYLP